MLECVINVSCGSDGPALTAIAGAAGPALLDLHRDAGHNRAVLTMAGPHVEAAARSVAATAVAVLDLRTHRGAHPRIGVLDVVPFIALSGSTAQAAVVARDGFARFAGTELDLPCFLYGPERSLPEVRRLAFGALAPDTGPARPHPSAGGCAVGARGALVAYNLWLADGELGRARQVARSLRGPAVRALGLSVGDGVQVSTNLIDPAVVGPADVYDAVAAAVPVARAELVGLVPRWVADTAPRQRWPELDLAEERTIEWRLARSAR
ncbi:MAG: hypothetical protein ACT4PW_02780 [Acidimicrobiia bacterium]